MIHNMTGGGAGLKLKVIGGIKPLSGDTLVWDGNTEGLIVLGGTFAKVSDATPSLADLSNGGSIYLYADGSLMQTMGLTVTEVSPGVLLVSQSGWVILEDGLEYDGSVFPEAGIYLPINSGADQIVVQINGYSGFDVEPVKENTVWIDTTTPINGYAFSATEPVNPVAGMVWFVTGTSSSAAMNVDKKNTVMLYPSGCYQYIGGAWIKKTALTYLNGAWVAWKLIIYEEGYINTDVIGSFISVGKKASSSNGGTAAAPTVQYLTDRINMYTQTNYKGGIVYTELPVDLTGFSTVYAKAYASGGYAPTLKIYSSIGEYQDSNVAATVTIAQGVTGTYSVDVSALTGEYYIGFALMASTSSVTCNVYNLWCE